MIHTNTYGNFWLSHLTAEQRSKNCGYWYVITSAHSPHTAFDTPAGVIRWMEERGLSVEKIPERGDWCRINGEYRTTAHLCDDPAEVETMDGLHTRTLSNGDYVVAVITTDPDGIRTVHTLNPNVPDRKVYDHRESNRIMGGNGSSGDR